MLCFRRCCMSSICCGVKGTRDGWKSVPLISIGNGLSTVPTGGQNADADDSPCDQPFGWGVEM